MKNYKDIKDLYILGDTSEVVANLDDSLVTINTVLSSRYVGGIREMVDDWRGKLVVLQVSFGGTHEGGLSANRPNARPFASHISPPAAES